MQAHRVRAAEELFQRPGRPHLRRELPGPGEGEPGVVPDHLHSERPRRVRDPDPDRAEPDDPEHPPRQLEPVEAPLPLLHRPLQRFALHVEGVHETERRQHVARGHEQPREDQLLDRVRVGPGGVEHRRPGLAQAFDRNVVDPDPGPRHRLHAVRERGGAQVRGAEEDRVRPLDLRPRSGTGPAGKRSSPALATSSSTRIRNIARDDVTRGGARSPRGTPPTARPPAPASRCRCSPSCRRARDAPRAR